MLRLGWIGLLPRSSPIYTAFLKRMGELGYEDGKNFSFGYVQLRSIEEYAGAFSQAVARGSDILVAPGNEAALRAAQSEGGSIPTWSARRKYLRCGACRSPSRRVNSWPSRALRAPVSPH